MLFHMSIDADDPQRVAKVFAEIWQGRAMPFTPVTVGSWVAMADDERHNLIEFYPRGIELIEVEGDADAQGVDGAAPRPHSATHMAIGTRMTADQILAIARREGWPAKYRKRGGAFGVIELWVEGWRMVEVLTPEMQQEYLSLRYGSEERPAGA
jgi:hypothetical protein